MQKLTRFDVIAILVLGEIVGAFFFAIFRVQCAAPEFRFFVCGLPQGAQIPLFFAGAPFAALAALSAAWFFSKRIPALFQVAKFIAVGVSNTAIDWGILNLLLAPLGFATGLYAAGKGFSFAIATLNSFFWNKFWTFRQSGTQKMTAQLAQFYVVTAIGLVINVGAATLLKVIGPETRFWAGILAPGFATLLSAAWNFLGYKLIVFKASPEKEL